MIKKLCACLMSVALMLTASNLARGGGWSVLTLDELPNRVIADQPTTIGFVVRQHGQHPLGGLDGNVIVNKVGERSLLFPIHESGATGHYTATITLPKAGVWQWRIDAFGEHAMPPLTVQAAVQNRPVTATGFTPAQLAALGKDLFVAKGCWTCHSHQAISRSGQFSDANGAVSAPSLTTPKFDATYLRVWLKDPKAVKPNTAMPNLNLKKTEIEALTAFLAAKSSATCQVTAGRPLVSNESAPVRSFVDKGHVLIGVIRSSNGCTPIARAKIVFLLTNPKGIYDADHRATVYTDADGAYRFESNFPGHYEGSPAPHIHLLVSAPGHRFIETEYILKQGQTSGAFDVTLASE
jgi:cytochrome c2